MQSKNENNSVNLLNVVIRRAEEEEKVEIGDDCTDSRLLLTAEEEED